VIIKTNPEDAQGALDRACAGDIIEFEKGVYYARLVLRNRHGTDRKPIILRAKGRALFSMDVSAEDFREDGNRLSKQVQDEGVLGDGYPGLWPWMMDGRLCLFDCSHIRVEGFHFRKSWPTHIAIQNAQNVEIRGCDFEDGTFAVGATGVKTRHITIDRCSWLQDPEPGRIWQKIPWQAIHGAPPDDPPVNIRQDWRLYDGDFYRGSEIAGDVTISNCRIGQAFNAIHLFNDHNSLDLCSNLHVHHCVFFEIRDNVIEAEKSAVNWWFHHNVIVNCHKLFSFELIRNPHVYLFSNLCWYNSIQGPEGDDNRGGGVFKLNARAKPPFGPVNVFHNSIVTRSDYIRKGVFAGLKHANNAILGVPQAGDGFDEHPDFFGNLRAAAKRVKKRFTVEWNRYGIDMAGDQICYSGWPDELRKKGYPIDGTIEPGNPDFVDPHSDDESGSGLQLGKQSSCRGTGQALSLILPDGKPWSSKAGSDVGAWQGKKQFAGPDYRPIDWEALNSEDNGAPSRVFRSS